jgi:hypothetical protein
LWQVVGVFVRFRAASSIYSYLASCRYFTQRTAHNTSTPQIQPLFFSVCYESFALAANLTLLNNSSWRSTNLFTHGPGHLHCRLIELTGTFDWTVARVARKISAWGWLFSHPNTLCHFAGRAGRKQPFKETSASVCWLARSWRRNTLELTPRPRNRILVFNIVTMIRQAGAEHFEARKGYGSKLEVA